MSLLDKIKSKLGAGTVETDPEPAYNLWAQTYDAQPGNLMLDFDEELFARILQKVPLRGKTVVDVGCGTGRHWNKILAQQPARLIGYDVSAGMLGKLQEKYTKAEVYQLHGNMLPEMRSASCDVIVSTLTMAHIHDIGEALHEWRRILKDDGAMVITDYHPVALARGANRTFVNNGITVSVKNYVHPIDRITAILKNEGLKIVHFEEKKIDDSVRHYYESRGALSVFNKFKDVPIIYGMVVSS